MRITEGKLRQVIREELTKIIETGEGPHSPLGKAVAALQADNYIDRWDIDAVTSFLTRRGLVPEEDVSGFVGDVMRIAGSDPGELDDIETATGTCPYCDQQVPLTPGGLVSYHDALTPRGESLNCPGSASEPLE